MSFMSRKLSRPTESRLSLIRNLAKNFIRFGTLTTSLSRAKETVRFVDKVVRLARGSTVLARRRVATLLSDRETERLLFKVVPRFGKKQGGFTKITRLGVRRGDGAPLVKLEWSVPAPAKPKVQEKARETRSQKHSH